MNAKRWAILLAGFGTVAPLAAQRPPRLDDLSGQRRPRLAAQADTNDWEAYFDYAVEYLRTQPGRARLGFFWAERLNPIRAEPLYGRWVAYWMGRSGWWEAYVHEEKSVVNAPQVLQVDSLYTRALQRNPFVAQTLGILLYDQLPGRWGSDELTRGRLEYSAGQMQEAASDFAIVIQRDPHRYYLIHYDRALAFTALQWWDSAAVELNEMLNEMQARDTTRIVHTYQSRELLLYGLGLLRLAQGDHPAGRAALEAALLENLSFYPAHVMLGQQALQDRRPAQALQEYAMALELSHGDLWARIQYGQALIRVGKPQDAAAQLDTVVQAEPLFADPYLDLGTARAAAGQPEAATTAFEMFLRLAPRNATENIAYARGRLAALATQPH
jgi:tetratricopeptide (TPR) repeat protein